MRGTSSDHHRLIEIASFGSNPGSLRAWLHLPSLMGPKTPLVVALHGCTQTAEAYATGSGWSQLAEQRGFAVLYPEQQRTNSANLCFNWFEPDDIKRNGGEALSIRQMIDHLSETQGVDPSRIFVTGLSAGGAMANVMLATYPETFAGGAILSGLPYGVAATVAEALQRMQARNSPDASTLQAVVRKASNHRRRWPRISIWHGTHDQVVRPANADQIVVQWSGAHGLSAEPARTERIGAHTRKVWNGADGNEALDVYLIKGMGHGVALAAHGEAPLGQTGPHMLDAGLSSTARIARSWGLATDEDVRRAEAQAGYAATEKTQAPSPLETALRAAGAHMSHAAAPGGGKISKVIHDALRAAGLMR